MKSSKILKIIIVFILFVACNTSINLDDEILSDYDSESSIIENQELNSIISNEDPLTLLALGDSYTIGEELMKKKDGLTNLLRLHMKMG